MPMPSIAVYIIIRTAVCHHRTFASPPSSAGSNHRPRSVPLINCFLSFHSLQRSLPRRCCSQNKWWHMAWPAPPSIHRMHGKERLFGNARKRVQISAIIPITGLPWNHTQPQRLRNFATDRLYRTSQHLLRLLKQSRTLSFEYPSSGLDQIFIARSP